MKVYLLDTNVFITAYRHNYPKAFWDWLIFAHKQGIVFSIDKVQDELHDKEEQQNLNDQLKEKIEAEQAFLRDWTEQAGDNIFKESYCDEVALVTEWVNVQIEEHNRWLPQALDKFLGKKAADLHLIAYAKEHGNTVVTLEVSDPKATGKIKIPDVCQDLNVEYIGLLEMLEKENPELLPYMDTDSLKSK